MEIDIQSILEQDFDLGFKSHYNNLNGGECNCGRGFACHCNSSSSFGDVKSAAAFNELKLNSNYHHQLESQKVNRRLLLFFKIKFNF